MKLYLFDDDIIDFYPITHTRICGDLRVGILKLRQRWEALIDADDTFICSSISLDGIYRERHPEWNINVPPSGDCLFLNPRIVVNKASLDAVNSLKIDECLYSNSKLVAIRTLCDAHQTFTDINDIKPTNTTRLDKELLLYNQLSDLIHDNDRMLRFDFDNFFADKDNYFETEPGVTILNPYNVWIGENVDIKPGVIVDASNGPVVIDDFAKIMHNAVIIGPSYIGKNSTIKIGAKVYPYCSIGPTSKIGGEIEGTIIQAYSNKQHEGFLGHSYIGEWVNLGADTNNSDLKNTYKNVGVYSYKTRNQVDSGTIFMGCIIGDHVKLGINSTINTGTVIGTGSNLWGLELISGFIPDFSWGQANAVTKYRLDSFLQTAEAVKKRRDIQLSNIEKQMYEHLYASSMEI